MRTGVEEGRGFLDCWGAADSKASSSQAWSVGLTCSVPRNLAGATTCGHSLPTNPGSAPAAQSEFISHSGSLHPLLPSLTLSLLLISCVPVQMTSACQYSLLCLPPSLIFFLFTKSFAMSKLNFCILYFIQLKKYQFCTSTMQVKVIIIFFKYCFCIFLSYHSGLIKVLALNRADIFR